MKKHQFQVNKQKQCGYWTETSIDFFNFFNDIWQTAVEKQQRKKLISQSNTMLNFRVAFILQ